MAVARLQNALDRLNAAIRDVENELAAMKAEHDPLASHIFISRRHYRNAHDTKGGKRREINARLNSETSLATWQWRAKVPLIGDESSRRCVVGKLTK